MGNVKPMTVGARLYRVEQQLSLLDKKLDHIIHAIGIIANQRSISNQIHTQPLITTTIGSDYSCSGGVGESISGDICQLSLQLPSTSPSPIPSPLSRNVQQDA